MEFITGFLFSFAEYYSSGGGQGSYGGGGYNNYEQSGHGVAGAGAVAGGWGASQAQAPSSYSGYPSGSDNQSGGYSTQSGAAAPATAYPLGSSSAGYSAYEQSYSSGGGFNDNSGQGGYGGSSYGGKFIYSVSYRRAPNC